LFTGAFLCNTNSPSLNTIKISCDILGKLARINVTLKCTSCTSSFKSHTIIISGSPIVIPNLPAGNYTVDIIALDITNANVATMEVITVSGIVTDTPSTYVPNTEQTTKDTTSE